MTFVVTLWNLKLNTDSDIVALTDAILYDPSASTHTVKGSLNQCLTGLYCEVELPINGVFNYAVLRGSGAIIYPTYHFFVESITPVASKAGVCRYRLRRDTVKDFLSEGNNSGETDPRNVMDGVFSALPYKTLETRLLVRPTTMYEASRTFLSDPVLPDDWFFVQVTAVITDANHQSDFKQYYTFVKSEAANYDNLSVRIADIGGVTYWGPALSNVINAIDDIIPNLTADSISDISISKRCPFMLKRDTDSLYQVYSLVKLDGTVITPDVTHGSGSDLQSCWWSSDTLTVFRYSDSLTFANLGWDVTYTRNSTFRDVSGIYIYSENNLEICEIPPEFFDSNDRVTMRVIPKSDHTGLTTDIRIGTMVYSIPEGKLPFTGSAWRTYQHDQMNLDRELMNLNIDRTKADAVLGASQSLVSGVMIGGLTSGAAAAASSAVGIAGNVASAYMNIDTIRKEQAAQEANVRRLNGSSYNTGYGLGYVFNSMTYQNCRISEHRPYGVTSAEIARYVKDNGYPAVGYRTVSVIPATTTGYYKGYVKRLYHTYTENGSTVTSYKFYNAELMRDFNARLSKGVKLIAQESDI